MGKRGSKAAPGGLSKSSVYEMVWTKETGTFVKTAKDSFIDERNDDESKRCKVGWRLNRQRKVFDVE